MRFKAFIVFYQLKFIWEPSAQLQFVPPTFEVTPDLYNNQSFEIFEKRYSFNKAIWLITLGVKIYFAFFIEDSFLSIWTQIQEFVSVDEKFRTPGRWHVKHFIVFAFILILVFFFFSSFSFPFSIKAFSFF